MGRHIVIIGGIGPQSSLELHRRLIDRAAALGAREVSAYPRISHFSLPVHDLTRPGTLEPDPAAIAALAGAAAGVELAADDRVVVACHTAHLLYDGIVRTLGHPVESLVAAAVGATVVTGARRVGLLASPATIASDLYGAPLRAAGREVILPGPDAIDRLEKVIVDLCANRPPAEAVPEVAALVTDLVDAGAERVLLGCTELSLLATHLDPARTVDPLAAVVERLLPAPTVGGQR